MSAHMYSTVITNKEHFTTRVRDGLLWISGADMGLLAEEM